MIVAASAADCHAQHRRTDGVDHIIEFIVTRRLKFLLRQLSREHPRTEKTCGHHRERVGRLDLVPGDLPPHELVVRHVFVERLDNKVAVVVGVMPVGVLLKAEAVRITREVEPVSAPAFAVMRGVEQSIDDTL